MGVTGFTPSVSRACIMSILLICAGLVHKKSDVWSNICLSLLILLIINPYNIKNNGVLLSYGGTIGIISFLGVLKDNNEEKSIAPYKYKDKLLSYIKNIVKVSSSAQILIFPIIAYSYKTISLTFIITNILTSYIIGLIIMFGFLIVLISFPFIEIAKVMGKIYGTLIELLLLITENTAKLPLSKVYIKAPYIYEIVLYYILVFYILYLYKNFGKEWIFEKIRKFISKIKKELKTVLVIASIISILFVFLQTIPKDLKIYFIDVDQGDSCLITTPFNKKILIDGGGSATNDVGKQILLPYILNRRITDIDYMICSHFDTDHIGGLKAILENIKVKNIVISKQKEEYENFKEIMNIVRTKNINVIVVKRGDILKFDKSSYMKIIYPLEKLAHNDINNNSIVAKFVCNGRKILFTRRY